MAKIKKISTAGMSKADWVSLRSGTIGGSDAASILGMNPYKSAYALWAEKIGEIEPEDISGKESVRLGTDLEEYVAKRFTEATGKKVRRENYTVFRDDMPFAHANYDRLLIGEKAGLECKTTNALHLSKFKGGEYPANYYCQCMHYLMVSGLERWYLAVLVLGIGFYVYTIERDEDEIAALEQAERRFWDMVQHRQRPDTDGSESTLDTLRAEFPEDNGGEMDLTGYAGDLAILEACGRQKKEITAKENAAKARIMAAMGEKEKGSYGDYRVSWKTQHRKDFDRTAFEKDRGSIPAIYFKDNPNRIFRFRKEKT